MPYSFYASESDLNATETASWVLGLSSSLVQGLLSFGGMLAIWPNNTFRAMTALTLTVAYEGEINRQNSKAAIVKFLDPNHIKNQVTKQYLAHKLAAFDRDRARFTLTPPTIDEQKKVCIMNEIVFIRLAEDQYAVGFCNASGDYEQQILNTIGSLSLKDYTNNQFIENERHITRFNKILKSHGINIKINNNHKNYPLYIKQYIKQLRRIHNLRDVLENQSPEDSDQKLLDSMETHVATIEAMITNSLFNVNSPDIQENIPDLFELPNGQSAYSYETMSIIRYCNETLNHGHTISSDVPEQNTTAFDAYHKNEFLKWIAPDREIWQSELAWYKLYSTLACVAGTISGLVMALGTCYLLMEALATIPLLALIPAGFVPFLLVPLALISGIGYGQQVYTSIDEMLADNPFQKFSRIFNTDRKNWTLKTKLFLGASVILFALSTVLTLCTIGTWITVFHQTLPFLNWLNYIPSVFLNYILPIVMGLSDLPFTLQSITNTLEGLENHPVINNWLEVCSGLVAGTHSFPTTWARWKSIFYAVGLACLGVSQEQFENETLYQKLNVWRVLLVVFKLLGAVLFMGHLFCEGEMSDRWEGFSVAAAVAAALIVNFFQDFDYFAGHAHMDTSDTQSVLKERFSGADDHNHDDNLPMLILKTLFNPVFYYAAKWSYDFRAEEDTASIEERLQQLKGIKPRDQAIIDSAAPAFATEKKHELFLFKSATANAPTLLHTSNCFSC